MASIGDVTRPAFAYDQATDTWVPVGIGPHSHTASGVGAVATSSFAAKGDLLVGTGAGTLVAQTIGANGTVLTADSTQADGVIWAAPAGGGKVLQVVSASITTSASIATGTYTDTNLTATITPTSSTSKILVLVMTHYYWSRSGSEANVRVQLLRDATSIGNINGDFFWGHFNSGSTSQEGRNTLPITFLDSPATTSATTYKTQALTQSGTSTVWNNGLGSTITLMEIGA